MGQRSFSNYSKRGIWVFLLGTTYCCGLAGYSPTGINIAAPPSPGVTVKGRVTNVVDGDTIDVAVTRIIRVRLLDCWAPEIHGPEKVKGLISSKEMAKVALNQEVTLSIPTSDDLQDSLTFGRVLGRVWIGDQDLSEYMVSKKLAGKTKPEEAKILKSP